MVQGVVLVFVVMVIVINLIVDMLERAARPEGGAGMSSETITATPRVATTPRSLWRDRAP